MGDWQNAEVPEPEGVDYVFASLYGGNLLQFKKDNKYGYLNTDGEIVIEAQFYEASDFSEGLAAVCREDGGCLEYINESGETVIKLDGVDGYQNIFRVVDEEPSCDFSDRVALIYCGNESFCIDKDGNGLGGCMGRRHFLNLLNLTALYHCINRGISTITDTTALFSAKNLVWHM